MRILESALYVEDVARAASFYERLFGFPAMVKDERFCAMAVPGGQVLLLFRKKATANSVMLPGGRTIPPHGGSGELHIAFGVERSELQKWLERLQAEGIEVESRIRWTLGGESIYFRDPDRHLIEIATRGTWRNF